MNVTLINLPWKMTGALKDYESPDREPAGIAYLAAFLLEHGYKVNIIDALLMDGYKKMKINEGFFIGASVDKILSLIEESRPDIIGISIPFTTQSQNAYNLAKAIRSKYPSEILIAGGAHTAVMPEDVLKNGFNFAVIGEGEITTLELLRNIDNPGQWKFIDGLAFRDDDRIFVNAPRCRIQNIDSLPFPARHLFPMEKYFKLLGKKTFILTSRGCPHDCIFCSAKKIWYRKWIPRSPENVIDELKTLITDYNIEEIVIRDDNFNLDLSRAERILDLIFQEKLKIKISVQQGLCVNNITKSFLLKLKKVGCNTIPLSIETGSQKTQFLIKKNLNLKETENTIKLAYSLGFNIYCNFLIGFPFETLEDIRESLSYARKIARYCIWFNVFEAVPEYGTDLYEFANEKGHLKGYDPGKLSHKGSSIWTENFTPNDITSIRMNFEKEFENIFKRPLLRRIYLKFRRRYAFYHSQRC